MEPFGPRKNIANYFGREVLLCGSTNYAHPGGLAALDSVIEILSDKNFTKTLSPLIKTFENGLQKFKKYSKVTDIRQKGLH